MKFYTLETLYLQTNNAFAIILFMDQSSYREWLILSKGILFSPHRFWKQLDVEKQSINQVLSSFLLPWLGLTSMIVFIGFMVVHPHIQYFEALKNTVVVFARLFFAVYAAAWIFDKLNAAFGCFIAFHQAFAMVAFTLPVLCAESILSIFFPETFFVKAVLLYSIILFYMGCTTVFNFGRLKALGFALLLFLTMLGVALSISLLLPIVNQPL